MQCVNFDFYIFHDSLLISEDTAERKTFLACNVKGKQWD